MQKMPTAKSTRLKILRRIRPPINSDIKLRPSDPVAAAHDRLGPAVRQHDVELRRSDHEVHMRRAAVAAGALELLLGHRLAALQRELVRRSERDVARGV